MPRKKTPPPKPEGIPASPRQKGASKATGTQIKTLRQLTSEFPSQEETNAVMDELLRSSDRAAALISAAILDHLLTLSLRSSFPQPEKHNTEEMKKQNGPLSSFYSKIYLGFAMGLYGAKTRSDLNIIRSVRNLFAHAMRPLKFTEPEIEAECMKLCRKQNLKEGEEGHLEIYQKIRPAMSAAKIRYLSTILIIRDELLLVIDRNLDVRDAKGVVPWDFDPLRLP